MYRSKPLHQKLMYNVIPQGVLRHVQNTKNVINPMGSNCFLIIILGLKEAYYYTNICYTFFLIVWFVIYVTLLLCILSSVIQFKEKVFQWWNWWYFERRETSSPTKESNARYSLQLMKKKSIFFYSELCGIINSNVSWRILQFKNCFWLYMS